MNMQTYVTHWAMETTSNNFRYAGIAAVDDYIALALQLDEHAQCSVLRVPQSCKLEMILTKVRKN